MKTCRDCKLEKPEEDFSKDSHTPSGLRAYCRGCAALRFAKDYASRREYHVNRSRQWALKNPDKKKRIQKNCDLKTAYGVSLVRFEEMLKAQGGNCKICGLPMRPPCVDHCHETKEVRGLLCTNCNTGIGLLKDSPANCLAAAAYLTPVSTASGS